MKAKHVIIYLLLVIVTSSCIREEAPNAEADILSCRLPGITMTTSPIINNNSVTLFVTPGTNISALAPEFTLTSGATITPASGTERNFNSPQEYQVTAADGIWKKTYAISVIDTELATGFFGGLVGMPIAAGNLFIGSFDVNNAMSNPLQATKFGLPFRHVPTYLAGYYKYKAGDQFTEGGKPVEGKHDICDIYAIMYETSVSVPTLDGTNAFTSPNLVSMARIKDAKETDEWTYFKLPFTTLPGKFIDKEKLTMGKYNISIVFTSSLEGDHFNGAIGSTLLIDEAELIYRSNLDH